MQHDPILTSGWDKSDISMCSIYIYIHIHTYTYTHTYISRIYPIVVLVPTGEHVSSKSLFLNVRFHRFLVHLPMGLALGCPYQQSWLGVPTGAVTKIRWLIGCRGVAYTTWCFIPRIVSGLVHPSYKWTHCPHLSHWNHQGCNPLTIRGMRHQVPSLWSWLVSRR